MSLLCTPVRWIRVKGPLGILKHRQSVITCRFLLRRTSGTVLWYRLGCGVVRHLPYKRKENKGMRSLITIYFVSLFLNLREGCILHQGDWRGSSLSCSTAERTIAKLFYAWTDARRAGHPSIFLPNALTD